jgi:pimeloyl-ACP methyl ester carboxylesterase
MRAREPDREGFVDRDGMKLHYEVFGDGEPTLVLVPSNPIVHSRQWKAQVPYLARHYRVVTYDGRGNGRSDRPVEPEAHTEEACVVAFSVGVPFMAPPHPFKDGSSFDQVLDSDEGWAKLNRHYWLRDYPGFVEFFFTEMLPEPHSTKQIEDCVGWALETSTEVMLAAADRCQPLARAERLAELAGAPLVTLRGAGHMIPARHPVKSNLLIKAFVDHLIQTEARMRVATTGQGGRGT